jgi:hypothetical protein
MTEAISKSKEIAALPPVARNDREGLPMGSARVLLDS